MKKVIRDDYFSNYMHAARGGNAYEYIESTIDLNTDMPTLNEEKFKMLVDKKNVKQPINNTILNEVVELGNTTFLDELKKLKENDNYSINNIHHQK